MAITILSQVTELELKQLQISRSEVGYTPLKHGQILRHERLTQRIHIAQLQAKLKAANIDKSIPTLCRWEVGLFNPRLNIISIWARLLGLSPAVMIHDADRKLIGDTWQYQLRQLRKDENVSQVHISAQIGVSFWAFSQFENDKKYPTIPELESWANALGCKASVLFERF